MRVVAVKNTTILVFDTAQDLKTVAEHLAGLLEAKNHQGKTAQWPAKYMVYDTRTSKDEAERILNRTGGCVSGARFAFRKRSPGEPASSFGVGKDKETTCPNCGSWAFVSDLDKDEGASAGLSCPACRSGIYTGTKDRLGS